jgi:hypothetical protein
VAAHGSFEACEGLKNCDPGFLYHILCDPVVAERGCPLSQMADNVL